MSKIAARLAEHFAYYENTDRVVLTGATGEDWEILSNHIRQIADEMDDDTAYAEVQNALICIAAEGLEYIEKNYYSYCEADIYTLDLIKWLGKSYNNLTLCNEAIEETPDLGSITNIIAAGQSMGKELAWRATVDLIRELEEEEDK